MWFYIVVLVISLIALHKFIQKENLPKGTKRLPEEKGYPLLGIVPKIQGTLHDYLMKLSDKHGPIFQFKMGTRRVITVNNYEYFCKCFKDNADIFSGRLKNNFMNQMIRHCGIILTDGDKWAKQRSFVLRVLRDFGLGKSQSFGMVEKECEYLLEELNKFDGQEAVEFTDYINYHTVNIISKFIANKRYELKDPDLTYIRKVFEETNTKRDFPRFLTLMFPEIDNSKLCIYLILHLTKWSNVFNRIHGYFEKEIADHKKQIDYDSEGIDLIDKFIIEQKKSIDETGSEGYFIDFQMVRIALELFLAGFETTSTTLTWTFFFLSKNQDIQEQLYKEIRNVIGVERIPDMTIKRQMPYTEAVMDEVLRLSSVVPLSIFHRTLDDVIIDGYFIPKDSLIMPNIYSVHRDSKIWKKPLEFYPEHFLLKDNKQNWIYNPRHEMNAFGMGKRQCLGELLARMEYFVFLVMLIQKFQVNFHNNISQEEYYEIIRANDGNIRKCKIQTFIFTPR